MVGLSRSDQLRGRSCATPRGHNICGHFSRRPNLVSITGDEQQCPAGTFDRDTLRRGAWNSRPIGRDERRALSFDLASASRGLHPPQQRSPSIARKHRPRTVADLLAGEKHCRGQIAWAGPVAVLPLPVKNVESRYGASRKTALRRRRHVRTDRWDDRCPAPIGGAEECKRALPHAVVLAREVTSTSSAPS